MTTQAAKERGYTIALTDHRKRRFDTIFYIGDDVDAPGLFVWGISKSGAHKIVSRPIRPRGRSKRNGRRVHRGWTTYAQAQTVADVLRAKYGTRKGQKKRSDGSGECAAYSERCQYGGLFTEDGVIYPEYY